MYKLLLCSVLALTLLVPCEGAVKRIISLSTAVTEGLYLLGAGDRIVGVTIYCERPLDAKKKEKVGTIKEINIEKIINLKPDLIIASPLTDKRLLKKLKDIGINVVSFSLPQDFSGLCRQFLELGEIVERKEIAEEIVRRAMEKVNKVKEKVKDLPRVSVFIQVGARPLCTMTKGSFMDDYIELSGGRNIAEEGHSWLYSREEVLRQDPDVIIIVTMGIAGEREKKMWRKFKSLNAVKNDRIFVLDSYRMCSPTPVSFAEMLEELVKILHEPS